MTNPAPKSAAVPAVPAITRDWSGNAPGEKHFEVVGVLKGGHRLTVAVVADPAVGRKLGRKAVEEGFASYSIKQMPYLACGWNVTRKA